jgi:hypothetical protein
MPVEIRELHINVSVSSPPGDQGSAGTASAGSGGGDARGNDRDAIVAECVEKVMEILQNKRER